MPNPAATPVRTQIREVIKGTFNATYFTDVESEHVASAIAQSDALIQSLAKAQKAGKHFVELMFGDDEVPGDGDQRVMQKDTFKFEVVALCHLRLLSDAEIQGGAEYEDLAERFAAEVNELVCGDDDLPGTGGDGSWAGLALYSRFLGGGGVYVGKDNNDLVTAGVFEVTYRVNRGDPYTAG